jgi:hypothetical protein
MFNTQLRTQLIDLLTDVEVLIAESAARLNAKYPGTAGVDETEDVLGSRNPNGWCGVTCSECTLSHCTFHPSRVPLPFRLQVGDRVRIKDTGATGIIELLENEWTGTMVKLDPAYQTDDIIDGTVYEVLNRAGLELLDLAPVRKVICGMCGVVLQNGSEPAIEKMCTPCHDDTMGNDGLCSSDQCRTCQSPNCTGNESYRLRTPNTCELHEWVWGCAECEVTTCRFSIRAKRNEPKGSSEYLAYLADPSGVLDPRR